MIRAGRAGYTLAELVVVLVILGVVAAGVAPAIRSVERDPLDSAADEVSRAALAARNAALQSGAPVRLTLDPATREFLIERMDDSSSTPLWRGALALGEGVTMDRSGGALRIVFARTGTAAPDSISLLSPDGSRLVRVGGWTGAPIVNREADGSR